jgi:hypothetical protein
MQNNTYVAAFQRWNHGISRLVTGEENVQRFIEDSKDSFAVMHLFTSISDAETAWDREQDAIIDSLTWS